MKTIAIVISFACFSLGLLAGEEPSPSPTPIFRHYAPHPGQVRRLNYFERKHESEARAEATQAKAQSRTDRRSLAATQAQAKAADRNRAQAQRQVAAETRIEARNETPRANSDLMSRMGFSEEEIAAQKAREQPAKPTAKETTNTMADAGRQPEHSASVSGTRVVGDHTTLPLAKTDGVAPQKPATISTGTDPDSH